MDSPQFISANLEALCNGVADVASRAEGVDGWRLALEKITSNCVLMLSLSSADHPAAATPHLTGRQSITDLLSIHVQLQQRWRGSIVSINGRELVLVRSFQDLKGIQQQQQQDATVAFEVEISLFVEPTTLPPPPSSAPPPPPSSAAPVSQSPPRVKMPAGMVSDLVCTLGQNLRLHLPPAIVGSLAATTKLIAFDAAYNNNKEDWGSGSRLEWLVWSAMARQFETKMSVSAAHAFDKWLGMAVLAEWGVKKSELTELVNAIVARLRAATEALGIAYYTPAFSLAKSVFLNRLDQAYNKLLSPEERSQLGLDLAEDTVDGEEQEDSNENLGRSVYPSINLILHCEQQVRLIEAQMPAELTGKRTKMPAPTPNWSKASVAITSQEVESGWMRKHLGDPKIQSIHDVFKLPAIKRRFLPRDTISEVRTDGATIFAPFRRPMRPELEWKSASAAKMRNKEKARKVFDREELAKANVRRAGFDPGASSLVGSTDNGDDSVGVGAQLRQPQYKKPNVVILKKVLEEPVRAEAAVRAEVLSQNPQAMNAQDAISTAAQSGGHVAAAFARATHAPVLAALESSSKIRRLRLKTRRGIRRKRVKEARRVMKAIRGGESALDVRVNIKKGDADFLSAMGLNVGRGEGGAIQPIKRSVQ